VSSDGLRFAVDCDAFYVAGWNSYTMLEAAAELPSGTFGIDYTGRGRSLVISVLDDAQSRGLNTVRVWAFTVIKDRPIQLAPGVFDQQLLQGLDFIMDAARARGIRVVLVLTDWWTQGGVQQFLGWSRTAWPGSQREAFFTDRDCQSMYQATARAFIERVNTINGRVYRDDPTLLSWELINEPRCRDCSASMQRWVATMARYVAAHDPFHLRSVGEEGFWAGGLLQSPGDRGAQPGVFATTTGTIHIWPENWSPFAPMGPVSSNPVAFASSFITQHADDCRALRKPVIVTEYGSSAGTVNALTGFTRSAFYAAVHRSIEAGINAGLPIAGDSFWLWYPAATRAQTASDSMAVYDDEPVMQQIVAHAMALRSMADARRGTMC
jgi:mannan endo-1,4-beta-mannosidase